jgi:hypothetical protein
VRLGYRAFRVRLELLVLLAHKVYPAMVKVELQALRVLLVQRVQPVHRDPLAWMDRWVLPVHKALKVPLG